MSQRKRRIDDDSGLNSEDRVGPLSDMERDMGSVPFSEPNENEIEAEEDDIDVLDDLIDDEVDALEDEVEGEDLFGAGMERDYAPNARLDQYDAEQLDETEYSQMDIQQQRVVEAKLDRRDREEARRGERGKMAAYIDDGVDGEDELLSKSLLQKRRRRRVPAIEGIDDMDLVEEMLDYDEDVLQRVSGASRQVPIHEFVMMEGPRQVLRKSFHDFLVQYLDSEGHSVYGERIKRMCETNGESLEVSFHHLQSSKAILAYYIANAPSEVLRIFDAVAYEVTLEAFEHYDQIKSEIHVRITDLPDTRTLRDLRQTDLNTLVKVSGVVTRRTTVFPQLKYVKFDCVKCGAVLGPFYQDASTDEIRIQNCPSCQSKGPFQVNSEETIYRNYQKITLQETPGTVPAGRLPRHKEVVLLWDLVDLVRPGEEAHITGIYRNNFDAALNTKNGFPVFATILEANHIAKKGDEYATFHLTEEDQKQIRLLARDPRIGKRVFQSIAPSIHGHEDIKTAIALAMFGGVPKNPQQKHQIRGDINVLALGDPGTAKSQFLKYVEKTAHRAVFTTGQGASAVGLTASVRKDPVTKEWTLEGGALVLADRGVCLIDEFDKMNDQDRTSIHEAMEQQSISVSKAGIVTTLQARCAVIAAANPIYGRYNTQLPFLQNVELTEPILSRFDILCVVKDKVDPTLDRELAKFVVHSHVRSHPDFDASIDGNLVKAQNSDIIEQELLKKYVMYAREKVHPRISQVDQDKIASLYAELRRQSQITGAIPITVRHLESIIRMAEASARMHLREWVRNQDVNLAIRVMVESFIGAQKWSVARGLRRAFARYITFARDSFELLLQLLNNMVNEQVKGILVKPQSEGVLPSSITLKVPEFEDRASELHIHDLSEFYSSSLFKDNGFIYDESLAVISKDL